jgi:prolipoprotein diacylglyceryltransferase
MIPFFDQPVLALGPLTIHAYGALVATGVIFGGWLVLRRARRMGLDAVETERLLTWMLVAGFVGAHLFSVFAYFPEKLARDPLLLFRIWEDLSSFGGIAGGAVGIWLYLRYRAPESVRLERWAYWDLIGFGLPFGWAFGRLGCTMAHDHPGKVTDFFLARSLESPEARAGRCRLPVGVVGVLGEGEVGVVLVVESLERPADPGRLVPEDDHHRVQSGGQEGPRSSTDHRFPVDVVEELVRVAVPAARARGEEHAGDSLVARSGASARGLRP